MNDYVIITDGSCDLKNEDIIKSNLTVVPFYVSFEESVYLREKVDVQIRDFYQQLVDNDDVYPKTSMPATDDYLKLFNEYAKKDIPVICLCITKKMSGSYNSATTARDLCLEDYPNAKITVVDTMTITVLQGLLVKEVCRMKTNGLSYEETLNKIEKIKNTGRIFFTVKGLAYLQHGGRIGKVTAVIGNVLRINPIIIFQNGEIGSGGVSLTRTRALLKIKEMVTEYFAKIGEKISDYIFSFGHGYDIAEGEEFYHKLINQIGINEEDMAFEQIGATIAVHTGPHAIGLGFIKKYDKVEEA